MTKLFDESQKQRRVILSSLLLFFLFSFTLSLYANNDGSRYTLTSVLSEGKWVQIKTSENAIYKLTYEDIKSMGFSDPSKVKLYGYGGWMIDTDFTKPYVDDLPEVSVWINKGNDNVFGAGDFILFYGRGVVGWTYNARSDYFEHRNNPYSLFGSYFLTESEEGFKEMPVIDSSSEEELAETTTLSTFDDYAVHEKDIVQITETGRELFGESFMSKSSQDFYFSLPGITSDDGKACLYFVGSPEQLTNVTLSILGNKILELSVNTPSEYVPATKAYGISSWTGDKSENTVVNLSYQSSGVSYLNYISLNYKRKLQFYNTSPFTFFRNKESRTKNVTYEISNASSNYLVWDISGNFDTQLVETSYSNNILQFSAEADTFLKEYVMLDPAKLFQKPEVIGVVKNQNLHGLEQTDMIIISPEIYLPYAETLAETHREEGLSVEVIRPELIYNEFSSGIKDATAYRRFMKMFYDRAETDSVKPKYLLLFGRGIFDNRHLTTTGSKMDPRYYLLTFQVENSISEYSSVGTDDYFGFLDDKEGVESDLMNNTLDIAVGRLPVSSTEQAFNVVNKIINYKNGKQSDWKNRIIFAADNTDYESGSNYCHHARDIDILATYVENNHKEYIVYKSYMDAFESVDVNGKTTIPGAKNKLMSALKEGCFLVDYMGHGSTKALSAEDMLNISDVRQMSFEHLPLWITATCDFGWPDGFNTSGGIEVLLNKNSGGIALFTTSRVVSSSRNYELSDKFMHHIFSKPNGERLRIGDIMRLSKNELGKDNNKLNFILLGDPALKLNYPEMTVNLEKINGEDLGYTDEDGKYVQNTFQFRALDKVTLEGYITDQEGNIITDFNGDIKTSVFDTKQTFRSTHVNTKTEKPFTFTDYPNVIHVGTDDVKDGRFSVSFIVPLDISYNDDENSLGKINFYALDNESGIDANGYFINYKLFGSNNDGEWTEDSPEIIEMYLNSSSFKEGDKVNATPFFYAKVYDEEGINVAGSGLGHDITISINSVPRVGYNLNSYYTVLNDGMGEIKYSIPELQDGEYILTFTIWDILNNPTVKTLSFVVDSKLRPDVIDVIASDNPARVKTTFEIIHDRPESKLGVEIFVYDLTGRAIWNYRETASSNWDNCLTVDWTLVDGKNSRVAPGTYIYKAIISTPNGKATTKAKKLIVLGQ
ncbi:type IX secretion system sortase PorU [Bacteroidales bacterium OttesenSCG-928-M11]|nr:type IX secretion system sortase PorU [Bacteroidales bacterium OttesenSCG-928-M11]